MNSEISPKRPQVQSPHLGDLIADPTVFAEIQNRREELAEHIQELAEASVNPALSGLKEDPRSGLENILTPGRPPRNEGEKAMEAIVEEWGRPALLIQGSTWQDPKLQEVKSRLDATRQFIEPTIPSVGRVELLNHPNYDFVGTAWMIDEDIMVTNRHVAETFAERNDKLFSFLQDPFTGEIYQAEIDFNEEHLTTEAPRLARIREIVYIEAYRADLPDMALIRVQILDTSLQLPPPLHLADKPPEFNEDIAVIGYPAKDSRNDSFVMHDIFNGIYNVKRLSPGRITGARSIGITHDCSTLGGNSGSPVIRLQTGEVVGLHYAGSFKKSNYAVSSSTIRAKLDQLQNQHYFTPTKAFSLSSNPIVDTSSDERAPTTADLSSEQGRTGYNPNFLGVEVPLPSPSDESAQPLAPVQDRDDGRLDYTHYSVLMNTERRMAMLTAVNIDGNKLFRFTRGRDKWYFDPRLSEEYQIGHDLYKHTHLHRGHLVRRLDPVWGDTREIAKQGELDTFFFTNCTPQHRRFNPRSWLKLEDHILENAATHELKVSVFTGPVSKDSDPAFRMGHIPEEYWKVVAIINSYTGELSCTGYLLSQTEFMDDLEFAFGEFQTFQVPVSLIQDKTKLNFGPMAHHDPLRNRESIASPAKQRTLIKSASDIIL